MANSYYKNFSSFRADMQAFYTIAKQQGLPSILPLISGTTPVGELSAVVVQLDTCIIQIALARFWISLGFEPQYVIGHSLGEYAALQIAGILSVSDVIYLCGHRARLLEQRCTAYTHGMIALLQAGYKHQTLDVPFAFLSSQVEPILDELQELASRIKFRKSELTMVSTLLGEIVTADAMNAQYITRHCRDIVNFLGAIQVAETAGIINTTSICIKIGAHPILTPKAKSIIGQGLRCFASLRREEDMFKTLANSVCGLHLTGQPNNWDEYHCDFEASHEILSLPRYSWQLSNYWMPYKYSWCLIKGDEPSRRRTPGMEAIKVVRLSDSIHRVVDQAHHDKTSSIVAESDLHDAALLTIVKNHKVNGLTMAPSTLFADKAFSLAKHLISHRWPETQTFMPAVNDMVVEKALILDENNSQPFGSSLKIDWAAMRGTVKIYGVNESGEQTTLHATCTVEIEDPETYLQEWHSKLYLIQRSISQLQSGIGDRSIHTLRQGMLYKLFSTSVQYGSLYQGIQQVCFDSDGLEGTGKVFLPSRKDTFMLNPYCCDSLGHLTGFIMNCSDSLDLAENVYVNHGWRYLRMTEPCQFDVHYQTYVKMQVVEPDDSIYTGDVHILRDGNIISVCGGVTFKKVSRQVLDMLLPRPSSIKTKPAVSKVPLETQVSLSPPKSSGTAPASPPERTGSTASAPVDFIQKALGILADEIGVEANHLTDSTPLVDLGVDSLMSLTILGNFRQELDLDVPAAQFYECITVKDFKNFILDFSGIIEEAIPSSASGTESSSFTSASTVPSPAGKDPVDITPTSPNLMTSPALSRTLQVLISTRWVSAFEAARQLVATGERVEKLVLVDPPNPVGLGKLPKRMYDFLTESGTFGGFDMGETAQSPPDWLFQQFSVFIEALDKYVPQPFELDSPPATTLIWAKDGVCKNPHDKRPEERVDDPRGMKWLLNNRTDLGPNGWDDLIGADNIRIRTIEDANHFTLLREPVVSSLCGMIREALDI
ncbi:hypothetical protein FGRMN_5225 [Fusarium graminum]|nr:hypothetical protein FGRMN_5225 [Fusarium graminum]